MKKVTVFPVARRQMLVACGSPAVLEHRPGVIGET